jgi:hypothetical protein
VIVCGLPDSCPVAQLGSLRQALTVIVLENVPSPKLTGEAGKTLVWPVVGLVITTDPIDPTAGPTLLMSI